MWRVFAYWYQVSLLRLFDNCHLRNAPYIGTRRLNRLLIVYGPFYNCNAAAAAAASAVSATATAVAGTAAAAVVGDGVAFAFAGVAAAALDMCLT